MGLLLALWAPVAAAQTIEANSTTVLRLKPDWQAGDTRTGFWGTELVGLSVRDIDMSGVDDLRIQLVTWLEVLEGSPDLAFAGGAISSGDAPDELRRGGAVQAIILALAASDSREAGAEVLSLPPDERRKKLKELAPHYLRDGLGH